MALTYPEHQQPLEGESHAEYQERYDGYRRGTLDRGWRMFAVLGHDATGAARSGRTEAMMRDAERDLMIGSYTTKESS